MKGRTRLEKRRKNGLTVEGEGATAADGVWRRQGLEDVVQGEKTQAESWRTKGRPSGGGRAALLPQIYGVLHACFRGACVQRRWLLWPHEKGLRRGTAERTAFIRTERVVLRVIRYPTGIGKVSQEYPRIFII